MSNVVHVIDYYGAYRTVDLHENELITEQL